MSSFQELIYKNGKIVGLSMNSNMASALHDVSTMVSSLSNLQTEVDSVKKDAVDKTDSITAQLNEATSRFDNAVRTINTSLVCPDFTMSDPPTADELNAINSTLVAGSLYTINGGNAVLVYRGALY
jgi:hypothetical protein